MDVLEDDTPDEVRHKCFAKQKAFNHHIMLSDDIIDYQLLYTSFEPVENIPGTDTPMTVLAYKNAVGLPYSRITFILSCLSGK